MCIEAIMGVVVSMAIHSRMDVGWLSERRGVCWGWRWFLRLGLSICIVLFLVSREEPFQRRVGFADWFETGITRRHNARWRLGLSRRLRWRENHLRWPLDQHRFGFVVVRGSLG